MPPTAGCSPPTPAVVVAAIEAGLVPHVLVVAAHSAGFRHGNLRALEYLPGFDDDRFDRHQRFFVDELAAWAEAELGASTDRSGRAVFGCSDGGGHALATGRLPPGPLRPRDRLLDRDGARTG